MREKEIVIISHERFLTKFYYNSDTNTMGVNLFKKFNLPDGIICHKNLAVKLYSIVPVLEHFHIKLLFTDIFRPVEMQQYLYNHWKEKTGKEPKFSLATVENAPHSKGIAFDVVLTDEQAEKLPLPSSSISYLSEQRNPDYEFSNTPEEKIKESNRNFLRTLMLCTGISPINKEWFHFQLPENESYSVITVEEVQNAFVFSYDDKTIKNSYFFNIFHDYKSDFFPEKTLFWINNEKYFQQFDFLGLQEFIQKLSGGLYNRKNY